LVAEVYEVFPYAIMVVDCNGRLITANRRGRELLERGGAEASASTCCGLLGCRSRGPLEDCCITRLALQAAKPLPELRVDVPAAPTGALWVTASPLDAEGSAVVLEMRPGSSQDPRARTRPEWPEGTTLRVFTLGQLRVETPDGPLHGDWLVQRPGQLLRFLVAERRRTVPTEMIAAAVWAQTGRNAANTVRQYVHALRDRLEPHRARHAESSFVLSSHGGYALNAERIWMDVDEFEQEVLCGRSALADGNRVLARERFERALELYRDDFAADEPYAEWAFDERERLSTLAGDALRAVSTLWQHEPHRSASYLERLGRMEPFDSDVHRELITALLRLGRRSRAMRHYDAFSRRLMAAFGDVPNFELADMIGPDPRPPNDHQTRSGRPT
jgi:DNA-binding SARP family transcriptional activator